MPTFCHLSLTCYQVVLLMLQDCFTPVQVSGSGTHLILLCADCTSMLSFLTYQPDFLLSQVELLLLHVCLELKHLLLAFLLLCTRPEVQESMPVSF